MSVMLDRAVERYYSPAIIQPVLDIYGVTLEQIRGKSRLKAICEARHACAYLLHQMGMRHVTIAEKLNYATYSSSVSSNKAMKDLMHVYPEVYGDLRNVFAGIIKKYNEHINHKS